MSDILNKSIINDKFFVSDDKEFYGKVIGYAGSGMYLIKGKIRNISFLKDVKNMANWAFFDTIKEAEDVFLKNTIAKL